MVLQHYLFISIFNYKSILFLFYLLHIGAIMKKISSTLSLFAISLLSTSAFAADLPSRNYYSEPQSNYSQPSSFTWTGFYAGVSAGYGWSATDQNVSDHGFTYLAPSYSKDSGSFLFGLQAGYNHQLNQNVVLGAEADINFARLKSREGSSFSYNGSGVGHYNYDVGTKIKWYGTLRGRVGFLPTERLMVYGTGGLAFADVKTAGSDLAIENNAVWNSGGSTSDVRWGWTLGAGTEYALTSNLTAKLEYSYVSLSSDKNRVGAGVFSNNYGGFLIKDDPSFHAVKAGLNYKF